MEFDKNLETLVNSWCDRREIALLRVILRAYPRMTGLTDEWGDLATALKTIRIRHWSRLTESEQEMLISLQHVAEGVLGSRNEN